MLTVHSKLRKQVNPHIRLEMHAKDNIKLNHTAKDTDRKSTGPFKSYDKSDKLPFNLLQHLTDLNHSGS